MSPLNVTARVSVPWAGWVKSPIERTSPSGSVSLRQGGHEDGERRVLGRGQRCRGRRPAGRSPAITVMVTSPTLLERPVRHPVVESVGPAEVRPRSVRETAVGVDGHRAAVGPETTAVAVSGSFSASVSFHRTPSGRFGSTTVDGQRVVLDDAERVALRRSGRR